MWGLVDAVIEGGGEQGRVRCEKGHIGSSDIRICDFGVEGADGDKHDGVGEGAEDVFGDDDKEVPWLDCAVARKDPNCEVRETRCDETADKSPHPERHGREIGAPFAGVVTKADLKWKVD